MTAPWWQGPLAAFDLETTGPDPMTARVVTATLLLIDGSKVDTREWLLDPGIEIPEEASAVHGVTTEHAREHGMPYPEGIHEIRAQLELAWAEGRVLCVYNASFDLTIMQREPARVGGAPDLVVGPVVDPFVIDREVDKYRRGKRTLGVTCAHYGIDLGEDAHTSGADALAAVRLGWKIANRYPELVGNVPIGDLMSNQAKWHANRQADFAAYLQRSNKDASGVNGDWPVRGAA